MHRGYLVIFCVLGVLWSFSKFPGYFGHLLAYQVVQQTFLMPMGYLVHFQLSGVFSCLSHFLSLWGRMAFFQSQGYFSHFEMNIELYFLQFQFFRMIQGYCGLFIGFNGISVIFLTSGVFQSFFEWQGCLSHFLSLWGRLAFFQSWGYFSRFH